MKIISAWLIDSKYWKYENDVSWLKLGHFISGSIYFFHFLSSFFPIVFFILCPFILKRPPNSFLFALFFSVQNLMALTLRKYGFKVKEHWTKTMKRTLWLWNKCAGEYMYMWRLPNCPVQNPFIRLGGGALHVGCYVLGDALHVGGPDHSCKCHEFCVRLEQWAWPLDLLCRVTVLREWTDCYG